MLFLIRVFVSLFFFFFKQKTAYEMRISDWSSDVCSSDLRGWYRMLLHERVAHASHQLATHDQIIECITALPRFEKQHIGIAQRGQIGRASCRERVCQYV